MGGEKNQGRVSGKGEGVSLAWLLFAHQSIKSRSSVVSWGVDSGNSLDRKDRAFPSGHRPESDFWGLVVGRSQCS